MRCRPPSRSGASRRTRPFAGRHRRAARAPDARAHDSREAGPERACETVSDDPCFVPGGPRIAPRQPHAGEVLWACRRDHVTWSCELRYHGEFGVEAQILREGELVIGRRFDMQAQAVRWAEEERTALERARS